MNDSSVSFSKQASFIAAQRNSAERHGLTPEGLMSGGGDGTSGDMEARVVRLENDIEHVKKDVSELKGDMKAALHQLATLNERVAHLPTKEGSLKVALATVAAVAALITFGEKLQSFIS